MIKIFIRQCFTETNENEVPVLQTVMSLIKRLAQTYGMAILNSTTAYHALNFREGFTQETGFPFSPETFGGRRDTLLEEADVIIAIRNAKSESTAFEVGYFLGMNRGDPNKKVFIFLWNKEEAKIKTTRLKQLPIISFDPENLKQLEADLIETVFKPLAISADFGHLLRPWCF